MTEHPVLYMGPEHDTIRATQYSQDMTYHPLWYLMSPLHHDDKNIQRLRAQAVATVAGALLQKGLRVFCPVAHNYWIREQSGMSLSHTHHFWLSVDEPFLSRCDGGIIAMLPGYEESRGISYEYSRLRHIGRPIMLYDPRHLFPPEVWYKLGEGES